MQCKKEEIYGKWARAQSHPVEPVEVQSGPCQERVISGEELKQRGMGHGGLGFFVNVNCITMRKNPVYVAFLSQFPPSESSKIRGVVRAEPQRADDFVEVFVGAFLDLYHQIATASAALMHCDIEQIVYACGEQPFAADTSAAIDKEGYWTAGYHLVVVTGFNTKLVRKEEAPSSYEDLLNPRWKGKLVLDTQDADWFHTLLEYFGEEKGLSFMKRLAQLNPDVRTGHTLEAQLLAAGEYSVSPILYGYRVAQMV